MVVIVYHAAVFEDEKEGQASPPLEYIYRIMLDPIEAPMNWITASVHLRLWSKLIF